MKRKLIDRTKPKFLFRIDVRHCAGFNIDSKMEFGLGLIIDVIEYIVEVNEQVAITDEQTTVTNEQVTELDGVVKGIASQIGVE